MAGAPCVGLHDFRALEADFNRNITISIAISDGAPAHQSRLHGLGTPALCGDWRDWVVGIRLRENASGAGSQRVAKLPSTPPGVRKAAAREVMEVPRARGQVG